jgi:hypothetical protein
MPSRPTKVSKPASAARVDRDARLDVDASLLGPGNDAFDTFAVVEHVDDGGVKQHLDAGFLEQMVACLAPDQGIMAVRESLAITDGIRDAALHLHHVQKAIGETEHHFLGRRRAVVGCSVKPADRAGQARHCRAAAKAVFLQQQDAGTRSCRGGGGSEASRTSADDKDVGFEVLSWPLIAHAHHNVSRFPPVITMTRRGAPCAENSPRPLAPAAFGGGSDNKEKILSPESAPTRRGQSPAGVLRDPAQ